MANNSGKPYPDKILQDVGRSQISRNKMLAPWANGRKMAVRRVGVFATGKSYSEFAFLCNGTDQHEIRGQRQSLSCIEP